MDEGTQEEVRRDHRFSLARWVGIRRVRKTLEEKESARDEIITQSTQEQLAISQIIEKLVHDCGAVEQLTNTRLAEHSDMNIGNRVTEICLQLNALSGNLKLLGTLVQTHGTMLFTQEMKLFDHKEENSEDDYFATEQRDALVKDVIDDEKRLDEFETAIGKLTATVDVHTKLLEDWQPLINLLKKDYADVLARGARSDQGTQ